MESLLDFIDDEGKILEVVMIDRVGWLQDMIVVGRLVVPNAVVLLLPSEMVAPLVTAHNSEHSLFLGEGDEVVHIEETPRVVWSRSRESPHHDN